MQPKLRPVRRALQVIASLAVVVLVSCGDGRNLHKVYPVKGKVLVNGQPANECRILLNRTFDDDHPFRVTPQGLTDQNGQFQITSYHPHDGAPEGEYVVTIEWRERTGLTKMNFDGPDQLNGAYAKVEKTKGLPGFVVRVGREPLELPPFELKQSAEVKRRSEESKRRRFDGSGPLK
jgi:hypothetical protein